MAWGKGNAGAPTFCLPLTAFDVEAVRRRGQAAAAPFRDTEERGLRAERKRLFGRVGRWESDGSDSRDVVDRIREADGGRSEDGRERRRAREGDALSPLCSSE